MSATTRPITREPQRLARSEGGFTLIEVLVVILIMGILMTAGTNMMISLFEDFARTSQMTDRDSSAVAVLSYASSQLVDAETPIGVLEDGGSRIEELSIAGDQLIFSTNGSCVRAFYVAAVKQLRAVHASSCSDPAITPERGPNQLPAADSNGDGFAEPGDPDFDPAIDSAGPHWLQQCGSQCGDGSFSVAENVVVGDDAVDGGGEPQAMSLFTYVLNTGSSLAPVDAEANEGSSNGWYQSTANAETIMAVDVHACVALSAQGAGVRCFAPRTIYLGQTGA